MTKGYLKNIIIESFGALQNRVLENFSPELTIVLGKNEAGKTTVAQCIRGVLYGWPEKRGQANTYKPKGGLRSATLQFHVKQQELILSRERNAEGIKGDETLIQEVCQLDKETYDSMFQLSSHSLKDLRNTNQLSSRLLTASTGTLVSPAAVLARVDEEIKELFSKSQNAAHSLPNLKVRKEELMSLCHTAAQDAEHFQSLAQELKSLNGEIAGYSEKKKSLEEPIQILSEVLSHNKEYQLELENLQISYKELSGHRGRQESICKLLSEEEPLPLKLITDKQEAALRKFSEQSIKDELAYKQDRDRLNERFLDSQAEYRAFEEREQINYGTKGLAKKRLIQTILSVAFPSVFLIVGSGFILYGREQASFSLSEFGVVLTLCALLMAVGSLVMLYRTKDPGQAQQEENEHYQWICLQDKNKYELAQEQLDAFYERFSNEVQDFNLPLEVQSPADLSAQLEVLANRRGRWREESNKLQTLYAQERSLQTQIRNKEEKIQVNAHRASKLTPYAEEELRCDVSLIQRELRDKKTYQETLERDLIVKERRRSEIETRLKSAQTDNNFNAIKLQIEQLNTRIRKAKERLTLLLLARESLRESIDIWQAHTQPEVYSLASEFFRLMTNDSYLSVQRNDKNQMIVETSYHAFRTVQELSLSTVQQLYLSLRLALLLTADEVGSVIPVVADDILVHFDEQRRAQAALCLARFAQSRQLIFFTCHRDIAELMLKSSENAKLIEL